MVRVTDLILCWWIWLMFLQGDFTLYLLWILIPTGELGLKRVYQSRIFSQRLGIIREPLLSYKMVSPPPINKRLLVYFRVGPVCFIPPLFAECEWRSFWHSHTLAQLRHAMLLLILEVGTLFFLTSCHDGKGSQKTELWFLTSVWYIKKKNISKCESASRWV